jgi:hypothetical protein
VRGILRPGNVTLLQFGRPTFEENGVVLRRVFLSALQGISVVTGMQAATEQPMSPRVAPLSSCSSNELPYQEWRATRGSHKHRSPDIEQNVRLCYRGRARRLAETRPSERYTLTRAAEDTDWHARPETAQNHGQCIFISYAKCIFHNASPTVAFGREVVFTMACYGDNERGHR